MPVFHDSLIQGSSEWLEFRKNKITATDIGVIMQISPYKSTFMLWQEKLGLIEPEPENDAMRRGKLLESDALREYCNLKKIDMSPAVVTHSEFPWAMASLDAISQDHTAICEIKCMGRKNHEEAMGGHVNPLYNMQMQWQMFVTGLYECDYFVYCDEYMGMPTSYRCITVKRDQELIDKMIIAAKEFLQCLRTITPPPFSDMDYEDKSNCPHWDNLMAYYADYDKMEKDGKAGKEHFKKLLIEAANGRNCKGSNSTFTKVITKGRVDYVKIVETYNITQEELEKYRGESVESYRITLAKGE